MKKKMIGRVQETKLLKEYLANGQSEFIAIYGRRRVGKTFFVRQVAGENFCFTLTGMEKSGLQKQLDNFFFTLRRYCPEARHPQSWLEAFYELENYLETLPAGKKTIFIDEMPWLDTVRSNFVGALEHFWNAWASARDDIKLIVCGSATSWMIDNIINNRGGLHNRKTHQIHIAPFTLHESEQYFSAYGFPYRQKEIAECYMAMGGVAYYYLLMRPDESVAQNIDRLFFTHDGELKGEFENLYRSLYKQAGDHIAIVTALSSKMKGLTRKEILQHTGLNNNQKFTKTMDELEKCGFIRQYVPFGKTKRDILFQLTDAYTLFHFHFAKDNLYQDEAFWTNSLNSPRYRAWSGYAFEMLCLNHIAQIKQALGISGVQCRVCCWIGRPEENSKDAQIDLLIDRADQSINVCEIKFSRSEYEITKADEENFDSKIETFIRQTKTKKSLILTLITSFGITMNKHSGHVQRQITLADLFAPLYQAL